MLTNDLRLFFVLFLQLFHRAVGTRKMAARVEGSWRFQEKWSIWMSKTCGRLIPFKPSWRNLELWVYCLKKSQLVVIILSVTLGQNLKVWDQQVLRILQVHVFWQNLPKHEWWKKRILVFSFSSPLHFFFFFIFHCSVAFRLLPITLHNKLESVSVINVKQF